MAGIQDVIEQMNQAPPDLEKKPEPSNGQPPQTPTPTPAATTVPTEPAKVPPATPPATPPAEPKTPAQTPAPGDNTAPAEPKTAGDQPTAPQTGDSDVSDTVFYGHLSKLTEGSIKTEQDFVGLINHYNALLEQEQQGFQPKYKDEQAKRVHEVLADLSGPEAAQAAMRTLRAIAFDPKGKSAPEVLFEAYLLDPKNSDLGPIEAQEYFKAEYDKMYSDIEDNPLTKRQQALAVREATQTIEKIKTDFQPAAEQQQQQARQVSEEVERGITDAVEDFGGIKMAFTDNPQESDFLSMAVEDPQELESLRQDALDIPKWWNGFMEQFMTDQGFDHGAFIREFYEMRNHQKKAQLAFQHGRKMEELAWINKSRNASSPADPSKSGGAPAAPAGPKSLEEAWAMSKGIKV